MCDSCSKVAMAYPGLHTGDCKNVIIINCLFWKSVMVLYNRNLEWIGSMQHLSKLTLIISITLIIMYLR